MIRLVYVLAPLVVAFGVMLAAPHALRSERWSVRHPDLAIGAWVSLILAGCALFALSICAALTLAIISAGRHHHSTWLGPTAVTILAWTGLAAVGALIALVAARFEPMSRAERATDLQLELLAARSGYGRDEVGGIPVVYVDGSRLAAMGVRCGGRRIIVTSALRERLTTGQLRTVLEHERAHLRRRHHLVLRLAGLNRACFPSLRGARAFGKSVHLLVEMSADDHAARVCGVDATASALERVAELQDLPSATLRARRLRCGLSAATSPKRLEVLQPQRVRDHQH
ncbi:M56 family metallopeptidase [Flexivirga meconopsidis]|uniref:M56 family metallopeptidase n=1 Tax=Flexivirga meconopsidis TaxID=2977121 RepID=UPI00223E8FE7